VTTGILLLLAIGALYYWGWRQSLRKWPYTKCRKCEGTQKNEGSNKERWGKCPECGGTGRRLRWGAKG
jgi:hypothetical protein